jgi:hypothetical protein
MTPSRNQAIPCAYIAGTINVTAGSVQNLLTLIQAQLTPDCPGAAAEFQIQADTANTGTVEFGAASSIAGALSATNYGYSLAANAIRLYRSTYPGASSPIGDVQVFSAAAAILHVEVRP